MSPPACRRRRETVTRAAAAGAVAATVHSLANVRRLRRPPPDPPAVVEPVSVLVPARDEAGRIGVCVAALLAAPGLANLEVLIGDDGSADGTATLARAAGGDDPRLRVLDVPAPPSGWLGKPHACAWLADRARGQALVFVDADVVVAPRGLAATVALLRGGRLDMVSPYPRLLADGWLERLTQPLLAWSWLTLLPLRLAESSPRPSLCAAGGQLMAVDAAAYRRAGGHAAVAGEVVDDVALARRVKAVGGRVAMADGTALATCRMYHGTREVVDGYTKSLGAAFGSTGGAAGVVALLAGLYVWPPVAAVCGLLRRRWPQVAAGTVGYLAAVAGRVVTARATGGRPGDAWAHPAGVAALAALTGVSVARRRAGTATWKGRPVTAGPGPLPATRRRVRRRRAR